MIKTILQSCIIVIGTRGYARSIESNVDSQRGQEMNERDRSSAVDLHAWGPKPEKPGRYVVRGFDDLNTEALVCVALDDGMLVCNLHGRNSDPVSEYSYFLSEIDDDFEWMELFPGTSIPSIDSGETKGNYERFATLHECGRYGQVVALLGEDDGRPEVRVFTRPDGFGTCSVAAQFDDDATGWSKAMQLFNSYAEDPTQMDQAAEIIHCSVFGEDA